jgi:hypothetical protein
MKQIQVHKAFVLHLPDESKRSFKAGTHEVEDHIGDHWYVQHHSTIVEDEVIEADEPVAQEPVKKAVAKKRAKSSEK